VSNLLSFPSLREARREASQWIARMDRGLTPAEKTELAGWASVPLNRRALREMAALWQDMGVLRTLAELFPLDHGQAAAPPPRRRNTLLAAAASLVLAVAAGLWWQLAMREDAPADVLRVETLETPEGEQRTVALRDGSAVVLNTDTLLSVTFGSAHRDLMLTRGEAHFRVAHDPEKPFRVFAGGRRVEAVGTAFSVRLREDGELEVLVTEGVVRVAEGAQGDPRWTRLVTARQLLNVDGQGQSTLRSVAEVEMDIRLAWQRGMLIFQGEALADVLREFDRYTTERIFIDDPGLARVRVGGYFRAGDVDALLVALRENFRIASTRDVHGHIHLTAAR
jgi:transmembrane sensor